MWGCVAMVLAIALLGVPTAASANTITVDDASDPDGTGCTLEHAIIAANTNMASGNCSTGSGSGTDVISFNLPSLNTITLTGALPDITTNVDIVGPGSSQLSVSGAGQFRPLRYTSGSTINSISGLNVTDGFCDNSCPGGAAGAGIFTSGTLTLTDVTVTANAAAVAGGTNAFPEGAGILNNGGTLHLVLSTVSGNMLFATNATNQNGPVGGGIFNNGTLTLDRSTVSGNQAVASTVTGNTTNAVGGGIDQFNGSISVSRSTISGNSASGTGGTANNTAIGGGIAMGNSIGNTLALDRTTVTGNSVSAGAPNTNQNAGGIQASGGAGSAFTIVSSTISGNTSPANTANLIFGGETQSIKNSIVSNPLGGGVNCTLASTASQGFNLEDTNTCGFAQPTDKPSSTPMLDSSLADNGGPTRTLALLTGSSAIEAGSSSPGETTDQRGLLRPSDDISVATPPGSDGSDIGAFEVQGQPFPAPLATTPPTTSPPTTTHRKKCKKRKKHAADAKKKCRKKKK
jgi:fibronectin-binding autotransporter adhesin